MEFNAIRNRCVFFIGVALFSLIQPKIAFAESPYALDLKKDIITGSLAAGVFALPFFIGDKSPEMRNSFQRDDINAFDKSLMFAYNENLETFSDVTLYGLMALPALSIVGNIKNNDAIFNTLLSYGVMYAEAFLLTSGTKDTLKNIINRDRPYNYFGGVPGGKEDDYANSFPSGHTSLAFMAAGFLSSTFSTEYPDSRWKIPVISAGYALALSVAVNRVLSGNHFISDVLVGAAIGSLYGYLVPWLHLQNKKNASVTFTPVLNGFVITRRF